VVAGSWLARAVDWLRLAFNLSSSLLQPKICHSRDLVPAAPSAVAAPQRW
jgi:hypothetical protein